MTSFLLPIIVFRVIAIVSMMPKETRIQGNYAVRRHAPVEPVDVEPVNCYFITSFVQEHNVHLYPETEKRLHRLCPTVSVHLVSGENVIDGVVETLLNRVEGSPCIPEEDTILKTIGLRCNNTTVMTAIDPCMSTKNARIKDHSTYMKNIDMDSIHYGLLQNLQMLHTMSQKIDIPFILLHGGLIGWYWNEKLLPWDTDIDVSIIDHISYESWLKSFPTTNDTVFQHEEHRDDRYKTFYKVSEEFVVYVDTNPKHHIESRLLHEPTGVYTDITYLYPQNSDYVMKANLNQLWGGHTFPQKQLLPLQECNINNIQLHCPHSVETILKNEYPGFKNKRFKEFVFLQDEKCWKHI
mgnify:CR=1 FL=1